MAPKPSRQDVDKLLKKLRDDPVDSNGGQDGNLLPPYNYLMEIGPSDDGITHWFCSKAHRTTQEASVFLLRLFAYNSDKVGDWKKRLRCVLCDCCDCIKALSGAKTTSRTTYFGAFPDRILKGFWEAFEKWETECILTNLRDAGIRQESQKSLDDAPPAMVYHILHVLPALQDTTILSLLRKRPPQRKSQYLWSPPPPGLLLLLMSDTEKLREWAKAQMPSGTVVEKAQFTDIYVKAFELIVSHMQRFGGEIQEVTEEDSIVSTEPSVLWSNFSYIIRTVPREILSGEVKLKDGVDVRKLVLGHLYDKSAHIRDVLLSTVQLLKKLDKDMWKGESEDYPQVVFDGIKDNPSFLELIVKLPPAGSELPWYLNWFMLFLQSTWDLPVYPELLAKVVAFMYGELQHERFQQARPAFMTSANKLLSETAKKLANHQDGRQFNGFSRVIDVHTDLIVTVALSKRYATPQWKMARRSALYLLQQLLERDIENIHNTTIAVSSAIAVGRVEYPHHLRAAPIRRQMWSKCHESFQGSNAESLSALLSLASQSCHLAKLSAQATNPVKRNPKLEPSLRERMEAAIDSINSGLDHIRSGFLAAISRYTDSSNASAILEVLKMKEVPLHLMCMMLSPVQEYHAAAQSIVRQAFDIDVRSECFRALLENLPEDSFGGILRYLDNYVSFVPRYVEGSDISKALVTCMTDIIEVLSSPPDGLLLSEAYVSRPLDPKASPQAPVSSIVPKLWSMMTKTITAIFRRTPDWSNYRETEVMTDWMRDALIFARELLDQLRVFESAALSDVGARDSSTRTSRKPASISKEMVSLLGDVLLELTRWLRLTDQELLFQSFSLVQGLLTALYDAGMKPSPEFMKKINKYIEQKERAGPTGANTRLDVSRLTELEELLGRFEEEPQPISPPVDTATTPPKGKKALPQPDKKVKVEIVIDDSPPRKPKTLPSVGQKKSLASSSSGKPQRSDMARPMQQTSADVSDQESSESDDEGPSGLAAFKRSPVKPARQTKPLQPPAPVERRQIKIMDDPKTNARSAMNERLKRQEDARRAVMRLKPDLGPLHRMILSWNYDHAGSEPPSIEPLRLTRIPDRFKEYDEYLKVFQPLFTLECWAQIQQSKDEPGETYTCSITSRHFVDDWLELDITIQGSLSKDWRLSETDIVLLRLVGHQTAQPALAKVTQYKLMGVIQASLRCHFPPGQDPGLQIGSSWTIEKVFSLSTIHREYAALKGLPYYDLCQSIFQPRLVKAGPIDQSRIVQAMKSYQVNEPQARAILAAMKTEGFSLIQGPPGTGKTWTISGLVGAFLSSRPKPSVAINAGRTATAADKIVPKVLICAPSNAAIDEVAKRLKDGVRDASGNRVSPNVVRVGAELSINASAREISLDYLVEQKLNPTGETKDTKGAAAADIATLRNEINKIKELRLQKQAELSAIQNNATKSFALEEEIRSLNSKRMTLSQQFDELKDKQKAQNRSQDALRRKFRMEVLIEADVICSTLSGSGHELLESFDFEMVIIDEAAQSVELSSLIPLKYRCTRCILVGDPQQLPPTVISQDASKWGYNQSMFVRIQKHCPEAVHLLSIQYRMHPDISRLPSRVFYDSRLSDGPGMAEKTKQPWHASPRFGVYKFFNVGRGQEESGTGRDGRSLVNKAECQVIVALFDRLRKEFSGFNFDFRIGIVSMYRAQVGQLKYLFKSRFGQDILKRVDFNTVDGFQGQEKDIIILSCVRAGPQVERVGFLSDVRRMNVAITRARSSLFIVGNAATLERSDKVWRQIVQDARDRPALVDADTSYFTAPATANAVDGLPPKPVPPRSTKTKTVPAAIPTNLSTPTALKQASVAKPASTKDTIMPDASPLSAGPADPGRNPIDTGIPGLTASITPPTASSAPAPTAEDSRVAEEVVPDLGKKRGREEEDGAKEDVAKPENKRLKESGPSMASTSAAAAKEALLQASTDPSGSKKRAREVEDRTNLEDPKRLKESGPENDVRPSAPQTAPKPPPKRPKQKPGIFIPKKIQR